MTWNRRIVALAGCAAALLAADSAFGAPPLVGGIFQLPAPNACFETATGNGCSSSGPADPIVNADGIAISPDGTSLYLASDNGSTIDNFSRNTTTGALVPATAAGGLGQFTDVDVSADGHNVYATTRDGGAQNGGLTAFARDPTTGDLGVVNCIVENDASSSCTNGAAGTTGLEDAQSVAVSDDGKAVYVAADNGGGATAGALTVFSRDAVSGAVTEIQCFPNTLSGSGPCSSAGSALGQSAGAGAVAVSPDGNNVYLAGTYGGGSVSALNRINAGASAGAISPSAPLINCISATAVAGCTQGTSALSGVTFGIAVSPDGLDVYVSAFDGGVSAYRRSPSTGALTFNQCLTGTSTAGCTLVPALTANEARQVAVSPNGDYVYVTVSGISGDGGLVAFSRNASTGQLTEINCASVLAASECAPVLGIANAEGVAVSPGDGRNVYVAAFDGGGSADGGLAEFGAQLTPSCQAGSVTVVSGSSVVLPLSCSDVEGDTVTPAITSGPAHGTLTTAFAYTPSVGYTGSDSVTYTGSDGTNASPPATITITVTAPPAPTLTAVTQSHRTWREGGKLATVARKRKPPVGTRFSFALNDPGTVRLAFTQSVVGRKATGGACVAQTHRNRHRKTCSRTVTRGKISFAGHAGTNTVAFDGRISSTNKLKPGAYTLVVTATNTVGVASKPARLRFTIVK